MREIDLLRGLDKARAAFNSPAPGPFVPQPGEPTPTIGIRGATAEPPQSMRCGSAFVRAPKGVSKSGDHVPVMLEHGEAVLPKKTVQKVGSASIKRLIENTTGKSPKKGLRAGAGYSIGVDGDELRQAQQRYTDAATSVAESAAPAETAAAEAAPEAEAASAGRLSQAWNGLKSRFSGAADTAANGAKSLVGARAGAALGAVGAATAPDLGLALGDKAMGGGNVPEEVKNSWNPVTALNFVGRGLANAYARSPLSDITPEQQKALDAQGQTPFNQEINPLTVSNAARMIPGAGGVVADALDRAGVGGTGLEAGKKIFAPVDITSPEAWGVKPAAPGKPPVPGAKVSTPSAADLESNPNAMPVAENPNEAARMLDAATSKTIGAATAAGGPDAGLRAIAGNDSLRAGLNSKYALEGNPLRVRQGLNGGAEITGNGAGAQGGQAGQGGPGIRAHTYGDENDIGGMGMHELMNVLANTGDLGKYAAAKHALKAQLQLSQMNATRGLEQARLMHDMAAQANQRAYERGQAGSKSIDEWIKNSPHATDEKGAFNQGRANELSRFYAANGASAAVDRNGKPVPLNELWANDPGQARAVMANMDAQKGIGDILNDYASDQVFGSKNGWAAPKLVGIRQGQKDDFTERGLSLARTLGNATGLAPGDYGKVAIFNVGGKQQAVPVTALTNDKQNGGEYTNILNKWAADNKQPLVGRGVLGGR